MLAKLLRYQRRFNMENIQSYNDDGNGISVVSSKSIPHCELCKEWENIERVMPISQFEGWTEPPLPRGCYDYVCKQLKNAGYTLKSLGWGTIKKINPYIYQIYFADGPIGGINTKEQVKENYINGVKYLKKALSEGIPVMVGIDDEDGSKNTDKITDHFVVIIGMGTDEMGNYFLFDDNATGEIDIGTSNKNRLYCLCEDWLIRGVADKRNRYFNKCTYQSYTVTQIRESKKINE